MGFVSSRSRQWKMMGCVEEEIVVDEVVILKRRLNKTFNYHF